MWVEWLEVHAKFAEVDGDFFHALLDQHGLVHVDGLSLSVLLGCLFVLFVIFAFALDELLDEVRVFEN